MALVKTNNQHYGDIAAAIRQKTGESTQYMPSEMALAISRIQASGQSEIIVTAPTGSVVTCSMGGSTKTAAEENGTWTFKNCDVGTWTVTASFNGNTDTKTVIIAQEGQLLRYEVTMSYFRAYISVTYPASCICVCTDGTTTLTAPDTSGTVTFEVSNAGNWRVSHTNENDYEVVAITENGQEESVSLSLVLLSNGDTCDDLTGGWSLNGSYLSLQSDCIKFNPSNNGYSAIKNYANTVDFVNPQPNATAVGIKYRLSCTTGDSYVAIMRLGVEFEDGTVLDEDSGSLSVLYSTTAMSQRTVQLAVPAKMKTQKFRVVVQFQHNNKGTTDMRLYSVFMNV